MPHSAHDSLLHRPGIRASAQELQIVIGLNHQHMAAAQMVANAGWHVSQVRTDANFYSIAAKCEANWVNSIMRDGEGHHGDVTNVESATRRERLNPLKRDSVAFAVARPSPIAIVCRPRYVNRDLQLLRQHI